MIKPLGKKTRWCTPYASIGHTPSIRIQGKASCGGISCLMFRVTSEGHMYISTWESTEQTSDSVVLQGLVFLNLFINLSSFTCV